MSKHITYKRIAKRSLLSVQRLYTSDTHILLVDGQFKEHYRRFYYEDITSLTWKVTSTGLIWNVILGLLVALFLAIGTLNPSVTTFVMAFLSVIFLILIAINTSKGKTCKVRLHTRVQHVALPSVTRVRIVKRLLGEMMPHIEATQGRGELPAQEVRDYCEMRLFESRAIYRRNSGIRVPPVPLPGAQ